MRIGSADLREVDHKEFVGHNLMIAREALQATQAQWTRDYALGSASKINQWERGKYYPNPWFLIRLCADHGLTMDWFYRGQRAGVASSVAADLRRAEAEISAASQAAADLAPASS